MVRYSRVPTPFINRAVAGSTCRRKGTSTVEPNMANRCCRLRGMVSRTGSFSSTWMIRRSSMDHDSFFLFISFILPYPAGKKEGMLVHSGGRPACGPPGFIRVSRNLRKLKKGLLLMQQSFKFQWCRGPESNRYGDHSPRDFKSLASASSATSAKKLNWRRRPESNWG